MRKTVKDPESNIHTIAHFVQIFVATQHEKQNQIVYPQYCS